MVNPADPRAVYRQIALDIRAAIWSRELRPGHAVPGITAIRERYGVANATAQDALALLKSWGLTEARPGIGTFVRDHRALAHNMTSMTFPDAAGNRLTWAQIATEQGMVGTQKVIGAGSKRPPVDVAEALGVSPADDVTWRQRALLLDGRAVQIATSWYPAVAVAIAPELGDPARLPRNSPALLAEKGLATVAIEDSVWARMGAAGEIHALGLEPGDPVTDILRIQTAADGAVVEVCSMISDGYRLRAVWKTKAASYLT